MYIELKQNGASTIKNLKAEGLYIDHNKLRTALRKIYVSQLKAVYRRTIFANDDRRRAEELKVVQDCIQCVLGIGFTCRNYNYDTVQAVQSASLRFVRKFAKRQATKDMTKETKSSKYAFEHQPWM